MSAVRPAVVRKVVTRRPVIRVAPVPGSTSESTPASASESAAGSSVDGVENVAEPPADPRPAPPGRTGPRRLRSVAPLAWGLVAALVVWCAALGYAATRTPTYEGVAVVAFVPRDAATTGAETMVLVAPKYVELLESPTLVDRAAAQLGADPAGLRARAGGLIEPNTLNLRIEVRDVDAVSAAAAARVLAAGVLATAANDPLVSAELVAPATTDAVPTAPTPEQVRLAGLALGAAVGVVLALSLARRRLARPAAPPRGGPTDPRVHRRLAETDDRRSVQHV